MAAQRESTVYPVGYLQFVCMGAILAAAAMRLPALRLTYQGDTLDWTIINSSGGWSVFVAVGAGILLTAVQVAWLRRPARLTAQRFVAVLVTLVGVGVGVVLVDLGVQIGFRQEIPEEFQASPGLASAVVIVAGAGYAWLAGRRFSHLVARPERAPPPNRATSA